MQRPKVLPLKSAYSFAVKHGLSDAVVEIKALETAHLTKPSMVRRGYIVELFHEVGILEAFTASHWPAGATDSGRVQIEYYRRIKKDYDNAPNPPLRQVLDRRGQSTRQKKPKRTRADQRTQPRTPDNRPLLWSDWRNLTSIGNDASGQLAVKSVVYQLRAVSITDNLVSQGRFLGSDPTGLLYIGLTSGTIGHRMEAILKGRKTGGVSHTVGRKLHVLDRLPAFQKVFESLSLQFRFAECDDPKLTETKLLKVYTASFGETPPLNGEFPNRGDLVAWGSHVDR